MTLMDDPMHCTLHTNLCHYFSPLTEVDLEDVGMFLIQLTNRDFLQSKPDNVDELDNCHDAIAFSLCNQIIAGMCICFESRKKIIVPSCSFDKINRNCTPKELFLALFLKVNQNIILETDKKKSLF